MDAALVPAVAVLDPLVPVIERVPQPSQPPSHASHVPHESQVGAVHAEQVGAGQAVGLAKLAPPEAHAPVPEEEMLLYSPQPAALNALTLILKLLALYCVLSTAEVVSTSTSAFQLDPLLVLVW